MITEFAHELFCPLRRRVDCLFKFGLLVGVLVPVSMLRVRILEHPCSTLPLLLENDCHALGRFCYVGDLVEVSRRLGVLDEHELGRERETQNLLITLSPVLSGCSLMMYVK